MRHHQGIRALRRLTWAAVVLFLLPCALRAGVAKTAPPSPRVHDITVQSAALHRPVKVRVLLPAGYAHSKQSYPVLYLLHGLYGDYTNWDKLTRLEEYTRRMPLIVVMPDAGNSWYVNSATVPGDKFEDFLVADVVPAIERQYRVLADRRHRAIAGLSMGGYGAMKYALKYPGMFSVAGSFSGALNAPLDLAQQEPKFAQYLDPVFGAPGSPTRAQNDLLALARDADPQAMPYFYLDCGTSDPYFIPVNRAFTALLRERGIAYEYHELPGAHDWQYWDRRLPVFLRLLREHDVVTWATARTDRKGER
jgi:putative tributyrin esterase